MPFTKAAYLKAPPANYPRKTGKTVIKNAQLPGIAERGAIALQHHGGKSDGKWVGPPSLLQFKNIFIKEL